MTLAELLALHPWPQDSATASRLEWLWTFEVAISPAQLWPVLSDTSRMNRALGVAEMKFEDVKGQRIGTSRPGGVPHRWVELPWAWVAEQWIESVRLYERGFSRVVYAVYHLEPLDGGARTRLTVYFGAVPRGLLGRVALRLGFPPLEAAYRRVLNEVASTARGAPIAALTVGAPALTAEVEQRLTSQRAALLEKGVDAACVDRLVDLVRHGDEQDLLRIQVRERARAWRLDEDALLRTCLHATRVGLLELSWDTVCPHCRNVVREANALGQVTARSDCPACAIEFGTDTDQAIEVTFHVHQSVRDVPRRMFCSAEPARKAHIKVQRAVPPGVTELHCPPLGDGKYRLRLGGEQRYGSLDVRLEPGVAPAPVEWRASQGPLERVVSAAPALRLLNDATEMRMFVVEEAGWADVALRPGRLLSHQEFRDLFSREYLAADVQLGIGEQTILFTDMVGSTAMYARRGDPAAFVEVKKHFAQVFAAIGAHKGAVVKTIGDAAMAAFNNPVDALRAALAIHQAFPPSGDEASTRLRISLNTGPCIAVRLNTELDYFGHTVNIAAKLQGLAEAWQVAMTQTTFEAPGVRAWLEEQKVQLEELTYESKAIAAPVAVRRWTVFR